MNRNTLTVFVATALAAASVTLVPAPRAVAQDKMGGKMMGDKMKMSAPVYACEECKSYYSAADAKKMGNKDPMGHPLKKMDKAPAGYMNASKMKMGDKMKMQGKMGMDHKMMGDKMKMVAPVFVCDECKEYFSAADAKKMSGKDPMGHPLKKMDKAPAGFMNASKMKSGGKM